MVDGCIQYQGYNKMEQQVIKNLISAIQNNINEQIGIINDMQKLYDFVNHHNFNQAIQFEELISKSEQPIELFLALSRLRRQTQKLVYQFEYLEPLPDIEVRKLNPKSSGFGHEITNVLEQLDNLLYAYAELSEADKFDESLRSSLNERNQNQVKRDEMIS
ncbi:unnamed protein product [Meloidogyne enterolobii]|uniref:Uncharacterized protein n=1 Tax=Meloidogyne enterolobii TaxID=390850 RepID=A0ACB0YMM4_MELEN